jgi:hypothetical protein
MRTWLAVVMFVPRWWRSAPELAAASSPALPGSMAAIGDSISQAADVCCWYGNHPANSCSTGYADWEPVVSHCERIIDVSMPAQLWRVSPSRSPGITTRCRSARGSRPRPPWC